MWNEEQPATATVLEEVPEPQNVPEDAPSEVRYETHFEESDTAWSRIESWLDRSLSDETDRWLADFRQWLQSVPEVPGLPLDALRRENLY